MHTDVPRRRSTEARVLAILSFDIQRFSSFTDTQRTRIATEFRDCVEASFTGELSHVWNERLFEQDGGDGITTGFDRRHLADIIDRVPAALQQELRELNHRTGLNVRMRMGIAVGPVQCTPDERVGTAPNQAIIDACRIADSEPTRRLLENSDQYATYLAVAVTPAAMGETVSSDPKWLRASEFVEVKVDIERKDYHSAAFLHVPSPSGPLLKFGLVNLHGGALSADGAGTPLEERIERAVQTWPSAPRSTEDRLAHTGREVHDYSVRTGDVGERSVVAGAGSRVEQDDRDQSGHRSNYAGRDNVVSHGGDVKVTNLDRDDQRPPFRFNGKDKFA